MANDTVADVALRPKEHRENRKKNRGRKVGDDQAQATAKFISCPPRKARLVIDAVRGKYAIDALAFLRFIPNRAAVYISKVLSSAVANAANNHGLDPNNLKVVEARVDEGPRMKRVQPRAQGRAYRILKRMCHIMIIVEEVEPKPVKPRKPKAAAPSRAAAARAARISAGEPTMTVTSPIPIEPENTTAAGDTSASEEETDAPASSATVVDTNFDAASPAAEAVPVETASTETAPVETAAAETETVTQGEQVADTADKTDEIGAPIVSETDAPKA